MGQRTTYFCDWCGITSPMETCVPHAWKRVDVGNLSVDGRGASNELLCEGCIDAIRKHFGQVMAERKDLQLRREGVQKLRNVPDEGGRT